MAESKYFPNLSNGVDEADVEQVETAFSLIEADIGHKVDKADGKGLSTNDFTNTDKAILESITKGQSGLTFNSGVQFNEAVTLQKYITTYGGISAYNENITAYNADVISQPSQGENHRLSKKADAPTIQTAVTNNTLLLADKTETQLLSSDTASLTLTTPATISNSYECAFSFKSGTTATTLVYAATPITWRGTDCDADGDFTPQANVSYEVSIKCLGKDADNNPVVVARVGAF